MIHLVYRREQPVCNDAMSNRLCNDAKLPYRDFEYYNISLDFILKNLDDSDHGYYIVCDINYTNKCKDRTEQLALMPNKKDN